MICKLTAILTFLLALNLVTIDSRADEFAVKGRAILEQNRQSIVSIQVILKMSYSGGSSGNEIKQELTGMVIDSSGLTVVALSASDPTEMYQRLAADDSSRSRIQTEITDVKILLEDGTELPAEIVLRDKDFDLAFLRPTTKPATPLVAVNLANSASALALDEVVALHRLNSAAGRACAAAHERISAVIKKPRTFYIPENTASISAGAPAFALDGNLLGVFVMRAISTKGGGRNYRNNMTVIILPAGDILKAAKQAPEPKKES
jgi:hypothetical protein